MVYKEIEGIVGEGKEGLFCFLIQGCQFWRIKRQIQDICFVFSFLPELLSYFTFYQMACLRNYVKVCPDTAFKIEQEQFSTLSLYKT